MDSGVVDSENSAVQESLALLFKSEAGVEYTNEPVDLTGLNEDLQIPPTDEYEIFDGANGQNEIINLMDEF